MATRCSSMHRRSRSDPVLGKSSNESDNFQLREIGQLKCLVKPKKMQFPKVPSDELRGEEALVRREMEKMLRHKLLFSEDSRNVDSISKIKDANELVREITVLELQVMYSERYLLSLYRRIFDRIVLSRLLAEPPESEEENSNFLGSELAGSPENSVCNPQDVLKDSGIFRSHSSLSHRSFRMSPKAEEFYHQSLPFSMLEQADIDAAIQEEQGNVSKTPNHLSEEMIDSISSLIYRLADLNPTNKQEFSYDPFRGREVTNLGRPYDNLWVAKSIRKDTEKLAEIEPLLKHYRSLVHQLERVNIGKLNHEEKLAFWINIHNSLVMHAVIFHGTPRSNMKRVSLMLKAAYNVGGRSLNLDTIQTSILGCRVSRPGQRFRFLFPMKPKGKSGDWRKNYAINRPEPLLHFALCSGNISDPSVRMYKPNNVKKVLEAAKEEYIISNIGFTKDKKILLPKLVESYGKDSDLCHFGIVEMIENSLPCDARDKLRECRNSKSWKFSIEWVPHDYGFGLLLPQEIA